MYSANGGAKKISGAQGGAPMSAPAANNVSGGYGSMYGMDGAGTGSMYGMNNANGGMAGGSGYGNMGGGYGGYGGGSMYGAGSMYMNQGMGSMMNVGFDEQIVVTKLFSSRRDLDSMASNAEFGRRHDSYWGSFGSVNGSHRSMYEDAGAGSMYGNSGDTGSPSAAAGSRGIGAPSKGPNDKSASSPKADVKSRSAPSLPDGSKKATTPQKSAVSPADSSKRGRDDLQTQPKPVSVSKTSSDASPKGKANDLDDIPLIKDDLPVAKSVTPSAAAARSGPAVGSSAGATGGESMFAKPTETGTESSKDGAKDGSKSRDINIDPEGAAAGGRDSRRRAASRHQRPPSRPNSRALTMEEVIVPVAKEVKDELIQGGLEDPVKLAKLEAERAEKQKQRIEKTRQVAAAKKAKEVEKAKKKQESEPAERRSRAQSMKMEEDKKRALKTAQEVREKQKEAEKVNSDRAMRETADKQAAAREAEKEAARVAALVAERKKELENAPEERAGSRPRSGRHSRPSSRPGSALRGVIPEQPPDEEAKELKDTLAEDELNSKGTDRKRGNTPKRSQSSQPSQPSQGTLAREKTEKGKDGESKPEPNMVKSLVLIEKKNKTNGAFKNNEQRVTYKSEHADVTEVKERSDGSFNYQSSVVHDLREAVCNGFNAAVLSVEAPNTDSRFESPVWPILNRIVRSLLAANTQDGELNPKFSLTCALGYFNRDRVKDLFNDDDNSPFEPFSVHPSPIYGPCVGQLRYGQITSGNNFEEVLSASLTRAMENPVLSGMNEGVAVAFVLIKQSRIINGKEDLLLSSLVVASAAADCTPYESALERVQSDSQKYASIFHLALNGPCYTCFMFNTADDDSIRTFGPQNGPSTSTELSRLFKLLQRMSKKENYPLRNGSVIRFINYMKTSVQNQKEKLKSNSLSAEERSKAERKLKDQEKLLSGAYKTLNEAGISFDKEL